MLIIRLHSRNTHVLNLAFSAPVLQLSLFSEYGAQVLAELDHCFSSPAIDLLCVPRRSCRSCRNDDLGVPFSGIEKDAVTIFTRFISPDAVRPIPITEQIRNDIVGGWPFLICCR